jgi:hypothetical protein
MHDVLELWIREIVERTLHILDAGPVFLTVDVDVRTPRSHRELGRRSQVA